MQNTTTISPGHVPRESHLGEGEVTAEAFRWLLIFGFPASVAAARLMPEVFHDALDEAAELVRRVTRNPFGL